MSALATTFRTILHGLKAVIARIAANDRPRTAFLVGIYGHLSRTVSRFEALVAHWRANTLPKQRHRPGRTPRLRATPKRPTGKSWMLRHVDHSDFRAHASQLQHFLTTEDCRKLLAEVPRAARILRPLARALGLLMPGDPLPPPPKPPITPDPPWFAPPALPEICIKVIARAPAFFSKPR
jgi:hypothetical protein